MKENSEILIVEDSQTQAKYLEQILREDGYFVRVARNGVQGLAMARNKKPAVILSDVIMPEMDGYEMCRSIKDDPSLCDIPVILLTSLSDPKDVIEGLKCGADNFLTKPYEIEHLLGRIHHVLINREIRKYGQAQMTIEVYFAGQYHKLTADRLQIIDLLLSTFEAAVLKSTQLEKMAEDYRKALDDTRKAQENHKKLMETIGDSIIVVSEDNTIKYVNPAARQLLKTEPSSIEGSVFPFPLKEGVSEITIRRTGNTTIVGDMRVIKSNWNGETVKVATIRDISETVELRERLKLEATTDPLTGLYNRRGFTAYGKECLKLSKETGTSIICLYGDLDGFKKINDSMGHKEGDKLLQATAKVLKDTFRASDIIGRIGGDEFAVLIPQNSPTNQSIEDISTRIETALNQFKSDELCSRHLSMSLGYITWNPENPMSLMELIVIADKKMYENKKKRLAR